MSKLCKRTACLSVDAWRGCLKEARAAFDYMAFRADSAGQ